MKLRARSSLLTSTACALALASPGFAPAFAVDVGDTTQPVESATVDNGAPGDVTIPASSTVELSSGVAVTINSDNSLNNAGTISITDADDAVGVRVLGGFTGMITSGGTILIDESLTRTDQDGDGTLDGPFAEGSGRRGILIEGAAPFVGDVQDAGTISIEGNDSFGIDVRTDLDGSLRAFGQESVVGDNSTAVNVAGDVSGDVRQRGTARVVGEGSEAVVIGGDVGGGVVVGGTVSATGFAYPSVTNYFDPDEVPANFEPPPLDGDDLKDGGPALAVAGSVSRGVLIDGTVGGGSADDDADGNDPVKDIKGDFDVNRTSGQASVLGSSPAVLISPDADYASLADGDIVIGVVIENVHDTLDDDDDGDVEEILASFAESHGFVNRGTITSDGFNVGFNSRGVVISGAQGASGPRDTIVTGGVLNTGQISAHAAEADATAVTIGAGARLTEFDANTPAFHNTGRITAETATETNHTVTVLLIEANSFVASLRNDAIMQATARGDAANVIAIRDLSGTLVNIDNTGSITSSFAFDNDDDDGDGLTIDLDERTGDQVAVDLSAHPAGQNVRFTQQRGTPTSDFNGDGVLDADDVAPAQTIGDVRFGAGDDTFEVLDGQVIGDVAFGAGADTLMIANGAQVTGAVSDADGQLAITVADGDLNLTAAQDLAATSVVLGDDSTTRFSLDLRGDTPAASRIVASGAIDIAGGAQITPQLIGLGSSALTQVEILRAQSGLALSGGQAIADNLSIDAPFLFEAGLATTTDAGGDAVVVTVRRRTAQELGMSAGEAAVYEPLVTALNQDNEVLLDLVNVQEGGQFFALYDQFLPEYAVAALQFSIANVDGAIGAVGNRLDAVRGGRVGQGGAWLQEFGVYLDRESAPGVPGYRGNGFGIATGIDRPFGPFYAVGVNLVGAASEIEETKGFDDPLSVSSAQFGAYAAAAAGNLLFDLYAGAGANFFDSHRRIVLDNVTRESLADWSGTHAAASARLAYDIQTRRIFVRPAVSVDFLQFDEDGYVESGGGAAIDLAVDERSTEVFSSTASLTMGARFGSQARTWWSPRLRVGYRQEQYTYATPTTARFVSGTDVFVLEPEDLPESGAIFGFTLAAGSRYSSFAFDYDADVRDGFIRHGARVAFRFVF